MAKDSTATSLIIENRKARHQYTIEDRFEAGLVLHGWEIKSLRAGRVQLIDSHVLIRQGEAWWLGGIINPLPTVSTHFIPDPSRTRKLLLHAAEINKLIGYIERKGYTVVPLKLYWKAGRVKVEIGLAKGKKLHDKRDAEKQKDWERERGKILKRG